MSFHSQGLPSSAFGSFRLGTMAVLARAFSSPSSCHTGNPNHSCEALLLWAPETSKKGRFFASEIKDLTFKIDGELWAIGDASQLGTWLFTGDLAELHERQSTLLNSFINQTKVCRITVLVHRKPTNTMAVLGIYLRLTQALHTSTQVSMAIWTSVTAKNDKKWVWPP